VAVTSVVDAGGVRVLAAAYRRIASCSLVADGVLAELVGPDRLVAVSQPFAASHGHLAWVATKAQVPPDARGVETLIDLRPDLVVVSNYAGDLGHLRRLREAGLAVFDLGPMLGVDTLVRNVQDLGAVVADGRAGRVLANRFLLELAEVAQAVPMADRRRGCFVNLYGDQLYGGTVGSSFHDVLTAAGLVDVAAPFIAARGDLARGWPQYRTEDLLLLDPEVIVTTTGKRALLARLPGLAGLRALRDPVGVVELDEELIHDPGLRMLEAARELFRRLYPELPPSR
jgi:iron complex transport system substrate-binding protein